MPPFGNKEGCSAARSSAISRAGGRARASPGRATARGVAERLLRRQRDAVLTDRSIRRAPAGFMARCRAGDEAAPIRR